MIAVSGLTRRYGAHTVLQGLNFQASAGEFVALLGPNGAGKTTFLRILASLSRFNGGSVQVCGCALPAQSNRARREIGFVSHLPLLYGDLTAEENLLFYARLYALPRPVPRIQQVLELVGLHSRRHDLLRTYSRGMQQRLSIARAILHAPRILLLDEPYTGLDQEASAMLDDTLRQVIAEGQTILLTSHDLLHAAELATRFDVLSAGKIRASTPRASLPPDGLLAFYRRALQEPA